MEISIVKQGQSFIDKVCQLTGNCENAIAMAIANDLSISEAIAIGTNVKTTAITSKNVVDFFEENQEPATAIALQVAKSKALKEGIGFWLIEDNFKVS